MKNKTKQSKHNDLPVKLEKDNSKKNAPQRKPLANFKPKPRFKSKLEEYRAIDKTMPDFYQEENEYADVMRLTAKHLGLTSVERATNIERVGDWCPDALRTETEEFDAQALLACCRQVQVGKVFLPHSNGKRFREKDGMAWLLAKFAKKQVEHPWPLTMALKKIAALKEAGVPNIEGKIEGTKVILWSVLTQQRYVYWPTEKHPKADGKIIYAAEEHWHFFRNGAREVFQRFADADLKLSLSLVAKIVLTEKLEALDFLNNVHDGAAIRGLWQMLTEEGYAHRLATRLTVEDLYDGL